MSRLSRQPPLRPRKSPTQQRAAQTVEEYSFAADGDARAGLARLARPDFGRRNGPAALQVETVACDHFVSVYEEG
jgi:hypothetical protein